MPPKSAPARPPLNLDYRAPDDDAWYSVRLLLEHDQPLALRIMYCEFGEAFDVVVVASESLKTPEAVEELRGRFRKSAVQLQDDECGRVIEGMEVCVANRFSDDDLRYYDGLVDCVTNSEHRYVNGELVCSCMFEVFWHHGPLAGTRSQKKVQDICLLQSGYPEDPTLKYFLEAAIENLNGTSNSVKRATKNPKRTSGLGEKVARRQNDNSNVVNDTRSVFNVADSKSEGVAAQQNVTRRKIDLSEKLNETSNDANAENKSPNRRGLQQNTVRCQNEQWVTIKDGFSDVSRSKIAEKCSQIKKNTSNSLTEAGSELNLARHDHVISSTKHDHLISQLEKNKGNLNTLRNERDMSIESKCNFSQRPSRPQFEIRRQLGERFCKESYYVIFMENLEKDLSSETVRNFIFEQTAIHSRVEISKNLLPVASFTAAIFIKAKEHAEKLLSFLLDPAHFVISSSRRPWVIKEDWCQQLDGVMPREENYNGRREMQCSNKIRMVYKGTREYERVEKLHALRCEFYDRVGSLNRRLESEEKLLLSRE